MLGYGSVCRESGKDCNPLIQSSWFCLAESTISRRALSWTTARSATKVNGGVKDLAIMITTAPHHTHTYTYSSNTSHTCTHTQATNFACVLEFRLTRLVHTFFRASSLAQAQHVPTLPESPTCWSACLHASCASSKASSLAQVERPRASDSDNDADRSALRSLRLLSCISALRSRPDRSPCVQNVAGAFSQMSGILCECACVCLMISYLV